MRIAAIILASLVLSSPAIAGGVSGGGGNSKPLHPVTPEQVKLMIKTANRYVIAHFNYLEHKKDDRSKWEGHEQLPTKLFGGGDQVTDWALRLPIQIKEDGPCLDPEGNPMDGSASLSPPAVCLSVPRLTEKLSRESLRGEVIALALHEFSHLVGATEDEADFLQTNAIEYFFSADFIKFENDIRAAGSTFYDLRKFAESADQLPPESPELWKDLFFSLDRTLSYIGNEAPWGQVSYLTFSSSHFIEQFSETFFRLDFMKAGVCEQGKIGGPDSCRAFLDRYFQADAEISYDTLMLRLGQKPGEFKEHPGVVFRRVRTRGDMQLELMRLGNETVHYRQYIDSMLGH
jgi:hypothetical protein